jgi:hypothetical protein
VCRTYLACVFANSHSKKLLLQLVCINRVVQKSEHTLNENVHECVFSYALHLVSLLLMSALAYIYHIQKWSFDDDDQVNGVRPRLRTVATNGPIVHPPDDI